MIEDEKPTRDALAGLTKPIAKRTHESENYKRFIAETKGEAKRRSTTPTGKEPPKECPKLPKRKR